MSKWKETNLGSELELLYGKGLKKLNRRQGNIPVYGSNGIVDCHDEYLLKGPGIIVGRKGSVGEVKFSKQDFFPIDTTYYVNLKNENDIKFFFYFLLTLKLNEMNSHSAVPGLNRNDVYAIDISLPPLPEQKAIAAVLSSLDDKIDLLHRQNKTLEALAETLFRQWFVEPARVGEPHAGGEAQDDWEEKPLEDLLEFVVDNRGRTAPTSETGRPLIATNCIKNENLFPTFEKIRFVSEDTYHNWFRSHPKPGDIIFVNKGTPGCINLVPEPVDFCIAQDMIALRVDKNKMSNYYLFLLLRSREVQSDIVNSSVGTTIPHLKKTDLLRFTIIVPNKNTLNAFDKILNPLFQKMELNYKQIRTLEKLRDTLLPKLMSGEVRVNV